MFKNEESKTHFYQFITIILIFVIVYLFYAQQNTKENLNKYKKQTVQEILADRYCTNLKYDEKDWKQKLDNCLKTAIDNPENTLKEYLKLNSDN